jgi:putative flippase GtrA
MTVLVRQFGRFTGVGFVSAIGHYGLLIALVQIGGVDPVAASAGGASLGAVINYLLNYRFTFRSTKQHKETILKFLLVAGVGLVLNIFFMWIGVKLFEVEYVLSQVITTVIVLFWSFFANRHWTFMP